MPNRRATLRPALLPAVLLACACFAQPAAADPAAPLPRPSNLRPDILYTHRGEFVQVKPMRPLTLNAHVEQFAYDPLGLEIAYVGSEPQGDQTLHFVKTLDARTGHEISRLSLSAPPEDIDAGFSLLGWSKSGKYLLLKRYNPDPKQPETALADFRRWDLSADPPSTHAIDPEDGLPPEMQSQDLEGSADCCASPDGRWLLFTQSIHTLKENGKPLDQNAYTLYDPEQDTFKRLTPPPNVNVYFSWTDNTHLRVDQDEQRKQLDVLTGGISPRPAAADTDKPAVSKQYPDLSLDTEQRPLMDMKDSGGQVASCIIWIRRTPFGKTPLGAAAAGLMPSRRENNAEINGMWWTSDDSQAVWSPTGRQVAFIANDDLYVTDLVNAPIGLPKEKLAVGLSLTCAEEQALASSDLKQIGLGLIQFLQDNDENFPAAEGFVKTVYPYLKTMDVFQVGSHRFIYEQPADLALAKMEAPADIEEGYMDLPCARVVLFCDGHVKVFPKEPTP